MGSVCCTQDITQSPSPFATAANREAVKRQRAKGPRSSSVSPPSHLGRKPSLQSDPDLTASSKATLTQQSGTPTNSKWMFQLNPKAGKEGAISEKEKIILNKWIKPKEGFKSTISESSESDSSSINSQKSQKSACVSILNGRGDRSEIIDAVREVKSGGVYKSQDESSVSHQQIIQVKEDSIIHKLDNFKHDDQQASQKSSDKSNKCQKGKKRQNDKKMQVLEKIIQQENDTCDEEDELSDASKIVKKPINKNRKEKKKTEENMFILRHLNHLRKLRQQHAKFDIDYLNKEKFNESNETGTSNILAGLCDTDKDESRVGGLGGDIQTNIAHLAPADLTDENYSSAQQKFKMRKTSSILKLSGARRDRLPSDFLVQEISDLEAYQSNVDQSVRMLGGKFKFRQQDATTTQGEETIGVITNFEEETTDFDQELGNIFRALIQNELNNDKSGTVGGGGLYANNINELSKIQQMIKKNDSFQSLINSQQNNDDSAQRIADDNHQLPGGQQQAATALDSAAKIRNEKLLDALLSDINQKDLDDIDNCNIDLPVIGGASSADFLPLPKKMKKSLTEKPPAAHLDKIEEDCESGGTEKSTHIDQVIKQDLKKVRQVIFDAEETGFIKTKKLSFSIKQIKLPANQKINKPVHHHFQNDKFYDNSELPQNSNSSEATPCAVKHHFKSSDKFKARKLRKLGKLEGQSTVAKENQCSQGIPIMQQIPPAPPISQMDKQSQGFLNQQL